MAGVPIADSMKVTVLLLQNVTGESMQFGFHTGKREDEDSLHDIHNAAVEFAMVSRGAASSAGCPSSGRRKRIGSPVAASRASIKSTTRMRTSRYPLQRSSHRSAPWWR